MPNAIDLLTDDHRKVEHLFAQYEDGGDPLVVRRICTELIEHSEIEDHIVYPVVRDRLPEGPALYQDAEAAHDTVKSLVAEAEDTTPAALPELVTELQTAVRRHVEAEESLILPRLQETIGDEELERLGADIERERASGRLAGIELG